MNCKEKCIELHSRTIVHIDMDCFYAQVEMINKPSLRNVPLGIQQKNIVVTSNYLAREYGIQKCMSVTDAIAACPSLVLVNGEDLYNYRKMSHQVTNYLQQFSEAVERLGLDENYIDVSNLVNDRCITKEGHDFHLRGHLFSQPHIDCQCGCQNRLIMGSVIAEEIRNGLKYTFNLTCCAGIAHNKLLAKLATSVHKPNQQTTVFPNSALELMLTLKNISCIPSIGCSTIKILEKLHIKDVKDLHNSKLETLKLALNSEKAKLVVDLSYGIDTSAVKSSGKPQSIGVEDSSKTMHLEMEIKEKFHQLLTRLVTLVSEDSRIPKTIKITIRKFDSVTKISHRETRQCNINPTLFTFKKNSDKLHLNEQSEKKLLSIIMRLFCKLLNTTQYFHITLLGLSFTKFQRVNERNSIASYFVKNVTVQSLMNIENTETNQSYRKSVPTTSANTLHTDQFEKEIEPLSKKSKITEGIMERYPEYESLSKLSVADLQLNSQEDIAIIPNSDVENGTYTIKNNEELIRCPPNADEGVFRQLPIGVQRELWNEWKQKRCKGASENLNNQVKKVKSNSVLNHFFKN